MRIHWVVNLSALVLFTKLTLQISLVQLTANNSTVVMYNNGVYSSQFFSTHTQFSCSLSNLFTYNQSAQNLQNNTSYQLSIQGINKNTSVSISTKFGIIVPNVTPAFCLEDCIFSIKNNCPNPVNLFNYFDTVILNIDGLQLFNYNVLCNANFGTSTFEAGQFIIVFVCFFIIIFCAIFNQVWAFPIKGLEVTYGYIAFYTFMLIIGGILLIVSQSTAQIVGDVAIWFIGSIGIVICFNELLFKLRIQQLEKTLINIKKIRIRFIDMVSFAIALGLLMSWILTDKNWILSDLISLCVMIGSIKILKITSFKKALILYLSEAATQILFVILIDILQKQSYEDFLLNDFNNPLEIQLPTINPVFGLKCSWLPVSVTIFPGILLSYFHRFDNSRNTKIYLITSSIAFFIGAMIWIIITSLSTISFPFQSITEPLMLTLVLLFAYNRKEIKVLWNGKFYDPEFKNQEDHDEQTYNYEMQTKKVELDQFFLDSLKIENYHDSQIQASESHQFQKKSNQLGINGIILAELKSKEKI